MTIVSEAFITELRKIAEICNKCDVMDGDVYCRDIPLSIKIVIGCGKWKGIDEDVIYTEIKGLLVLEKVIDDIIHKDKGGAAFE